MTGKITEGAKEADLVRIIPDSDAHSPMRALVSRATFRFGQRVRKTKGSSWQGPIVGFYSTEQTPIGYCVESEREPGSVQVYPETALEPAPPQPSAEVESAALHECWEQIQGLLSAASNNTTGERDTYADGIYSGLVMALRVVHSKAQVEWEAANPVIGGDHAG